VDNQINYSEIPMGLSMALAKNIKALEHFISLSPEGRQRIIESTHRIESKQEMQAYVDSLGGTM